MPQDPQKSSRVSTSSLDRLSSHRTEAVLDETISDLIEAHDNTFQCTPPLREALAGKFSHVDRYGRTPACLAASLGKKRLAQAIIKLGGGDRILDVRQMSAEDYLALPDAHFDERAKTSQTIEAHRIDARIAHHRPHPVITRSTESDASNAIEGAPPEPNADDS